METTIFFLTISLFTTTLCLPVHQPQDIESFILLPTALTADAASHQVDFSPEEAVELLDPAEYDFSAPEGGEAMETAANMVFRPLFSYRKIQEQRKRLYGGKRESTTSSPNSLRRSQVYYAPPGRYVYSQNYQGYPYYYRNAPYDSK